MFISNAFVFYEISFESMRVHLNKRTHRNNNFYSAIFRIQDQLCLKYLNIQSRLNHNHNYCNSKTTKSYNNTHDIQMKAMLLFYESSSSKLL